MPEISKQEIDRINAMCINGFRFNPRSLEAQVMGILTKTITLPQCRIVIQLNIRWKEETQERRNAAGILVGVVTDNVVPLLHCICWHCSEDTEEPSSLGIAGFHTFSALSSPTQDLAVLWEAAGLVTDTLVRSLLPESDRGAYDRATRDKTDNG